jgi:hypothetical protein
MCIFFLPFFLMVPGFELKFSCLICSALQLDRLCQPFFVLGFFEIGPQELFAWGWL